MSFVKFAVSYVPTLCRLWTLRNLTTAADYEYRTYNSHHLLQRYWIRSRVKILQKLIGLPGKLLDVGCGSSYFTVKTPNIVGLDTSAAKLRFISKLGVEAVKGNAENLPFENESFDQVVMSQVLAYVENPVKAIEEARRVLKTNGKLVIAVSDSGRVNWRIIGFFYSLLPNVKKQVARNSFSRATLVDLLAENGFRALKYNYVCSAELILLLEKVA